MTSYLVTTNKDLLPSTPIFMVDGTVPGWQTRPGIDLHFDHHITGEAVQLGGIPDEVQLSENATFVTTQVDADACVAAAWVQLLQRPLLESERYEVWRNLYAVAHDCDHLGLPPDPKWNEYRDFARKAVAAMKEVGNSYIAELGLPDRKTWTEDQKVEYASYAFKKGTEWLIEAALGNCSYPGEQGEADAYFERMESQRQKVYENCTLYKGCTIFDQRSFDCYVDPRLAVEWARENNAAETITLTVREGKRQPNSSLLINSLDTLYSYTLGSIPLHPKGSPKFSDRNAWINLQGLEIKLRKEADLPMPLTAWGGRNEVGGSSWRDPAIVAPHQVIDCVLNL